MQFQVPQFIEVEDKIIGPLTLKQFFYLAGAAGFSFILYFMVQTWLWVILTAILAVLAFSFAFIKYNGRPLIFMFISAFKYAWQPKFYLWRRQAVEEQLPHITSIPKAAPPQPVQPLKNLWLKMNTSTQTIEKREKPASAFLLFKKPKGIVEHFEAIQKQTGEQELYRRVDYR